MKTICLLIPQSLYLGWCFLLAFIYVLPFQNNQVYFLFTIRHNVFQSEDCLIDRKIYEVNKIKWANYHAIVGKVFFERDICSLFVQNVQILYNVPAVICWK